MGELNFFRANCTLAHQASLGASRPSLLANRAEYRVPDTCGESPHVFMCRFSLEINIKSSTQKIGNFTSELSFIMKIYQIVFLLLDALEIMFWWSASSFLASATRDILCVQLRKSTRRRGQSTECAGCLSDVRAPWQRPLKGQCRRSSDADVQFYSFQINILFNLSIIYQYFSMQSFRDYSERIWIIKYSHKNWYFLLFF